MRDRIRASAILAVLSTALAACGSPQARADATDVPDAPGGSDAAPDGGDAAPDGGDAAPDDSDAAPDGGGPAGFFIMGDIDGQTWLATHNIGPVANNFLFVVATVEPSPPSREWQFNFTLPADPFPYTLDCVGNYIEFHEIGFDPERRFVSRTATSNCAVTFVQPAEAATLEGTFTANLTLRGTSTDYAVTNGRFRLPLAP